MSKNSYMRKVKMGEVVRYRRQKGDCALPVLSVTMDAGVVRRNTLERKIQECEDINSYQYVAKGDLVYNMMRMWQGASGISQEDGLISPAYIVCAPTDNIDPLFLGYFCKLNATIQNFERYSYGITGDRLRLYFKDLASIPISLPPLSDQKRVVQVLATWDRAIDLTERLLAEKQKLRKGLMQQLLTGKRRFLRFTKNTAVRKTRFGAIPKDWGYPRIGDVAGYVSAKNADGTALPVLSCTKHKGLVDSLEYFGKQVFSKDLSTYKIVRRGQFAYATNHIEEGSIGYQDLHDEAVISPMYTVFEAGGKVNDAFLYLLLKTDLYRHIFQARTSASVDRRGSLRWNDFSKIRIPLPRLDEQAKIVGAFVKLDHELSLLDAKLEALREQKRGLMQQLLTGKVRVPAAVTGTT
ncbi:MAG: restriction endonuclease subunit S [Spirochaetota bacterium]